jgi:hypothetical protein
MIRILYWLIKRRWAVCRECKHCVQNGINIGLPLNKNVDGCKYYKREFERNFISGDNPEPKITMCWEHNESGCCWGFEPKPKDDYIKSSEPWPRY